MVWYAVRLNGLEWIMKSRRYLLHVFLLHPLLFFLRFHFCPWMQIAMKKMHAVAVVDDVVVVDYDVEDDVVVVGGGGGDSETCTA